MNATNFDQYILPESEQKRSINWARIPPHEWPLILAIAGRGLRMLQDIASRRGQKGIHAELRADAQTLAMDIAVAHLSRGLDLLRFHEAPADPFLADFIDIILNVNRIDGVLPDFVHLRCASPALKPTKET
jgi:hypothetical protein